jgi:hypothetical protein
MTTSLGLKPIELDMTRLRESLAGEYRRPVMLSMTMGLRLSEGRGGYLGAGANKDEE